MHLQEIGGGQTYAQLSAASLADPTNTKLAGQVATVFKGTTLRGLLLEAYAFSTFGEIALVASIVSFVLAGIMLLLTVLGLLHIAGFPMTRNSPRCTRRCSSPSERSGTRSQSLWPAHRRGRRT